MAKKTYFFKGLGCPKNEVDGDIIQGYLRQRGLSEVESPDEADYLIVNTCAFIQAAKEESIEEVLKLAAVKSADNKKRLLVTGCLSQRYPNELLQGIPEVDGMIGIDQLDKINTILERDSVYITRPPSQYREAHSVQVLRDRPYAYLKIADGCDCRCSYCAIPMMRGNFRSRSLEAIERDVDRLLAHGVVEFNLIAQDVAYYGNDIGKHPLDLLQMLEAKPDTYWVRPFYLHPRHVTTEILDFFAQSKKFCSYLESPIQHISSRLLKRMNRGYDRDFIYRMIELLRTKLPATVWRTTFIVGFPGETRKEFDELCDFVVTERICRAGVFAYSHEDGTPSYRFRNTLSQSMIKGRQEELTRLINENAEEFNRSLIGKEFNMLIEGYDSESGLITGRLFCDAPEIDFSIRVPSEAPVPMGFSRIRVTAVDSEGFVGSLSGGTNYGARLVV